MTLARVTAAILFLVLAIALQTSFASVHITMNVILATLVAFAFVFDIYELVFFALLAIFLFNWQPFVGPELAIMGALPVAAFGLHRSLPWQPSAGNLIAIFCSIVFLYLAMAPTHFIANLPALFLDLAASLLFGSLAFAFARRIKRI